MNVQQTTELLLRIQVIDNRRVEEATVLAWHELVGDLDYAVAIEAVRVHQRESTAYLLPAHVRAIADRIVNAVEVPRDEWGNELEADTVALEARERVTHGRLGIGR